jgi:hypothetical protein
MQRAGIVMMPLACAFLGLARSPTLWQMTLRSASSLKSHPTVAHSIARVCGSADKYCQDGSGWALSSQRMMTRGQSWRISGSQAYDSASRIITDYRPACCDSAATPLRQVPTARPCRSLNHPIGKTHPRLPNQPSNQDSKSYHQPLNRRILHALLLGYRSA